MCLTILFLASFAIIHHDLNGLKSSHKDYRLCPSRSPFKSTNAISSFVSVFLTGIH